MLSENESAHAIKSKRLRVGDECQLINGTGLTASCVVQNIEAKKLVALIKEIFEHRPPDSLFSIAVALPKGDRQRTMIDMLTQLGVSDIYPLACRHSVTKFNTNTRKKWQRTAVEACKQSQNPWLPEIHELFSIEEMLQELNARADTLACYADAAGDSILELSSPGKKLVVLIGPEGGFSKHEIECFKASGLHALTLAKTILRTETAAVSAAAQLSANVIEND